MATEETRSGRPESPTQQVTSVGVALALVGTAVLRGKHGRLALRMNVSNDESVDQFEVRGLVGGVETTLYNTGTDFTSPAGLIIAASGDLTLQAANTTGWLVMDADPFTELRFYAACALAGPTNITVDFQAHWVKAF